MAATSMRRRAQTGSPKFWFFHLQCRPRNKIMLTPLHLIFHPPIPFSATATPSSKTALYPQRHKLRAIGTCFESIMWKVFTKWVMDQACEGRGVATRTTGCEADGTNRGLAMSPKQCLHSGVLTCVLSNWPQWWCS